jgi:hypothetical protein
MGFNIGVHSEQIPNSFDCHQFLDRAFYSFVSSGEEYGEQSILIQSGKYYGVDLSPLLKLVYTWDEVTQDYIRENIQSTDDFLNLVTTFRDRILEDRTVCNKINYTGYEKSLNLSEQDMQSLINALGETAAAPLMKMMKEERTQREENPNPWKSYFTDGHILEDLNNLIKSIQCFKDKGATEIYLTAG